MKRTRSASTSKQAPRSHFSRRTTSMASVTVAAARLARAAGHGRGVVVDELGLAAQPLEELHRDVARGAVGGVGEDLVVLLPAERRVERLHALGDV
jgi:hypothetical protein